MSASRLPGKVLMDVAGAPALERLVRRLTRAECIDAVVLATTTNPADDDLADWAEARHLPCYRGSEDDVLDRVVEAQRMMGSEIIVEICGDTPLLDPRVIDTAVTRFLKGDVDVVSNTAKLTWPQGIDAQVFRLRKRRPTPPCANMSRCISMNTPRPTAFTILPRPPRKPRPRSACNSITPKTWT